MQSPKYQHDCGKCTFLGHVLDADLYICMLEDRSDGSVIARYGDEGGQYSSHSTMGMKSMLKRGFIIGDHTQKKRIITNVPFKSTALLILAMSLAREKGLTRWEAA